MTDRLNLTGCYFDGEQPPEYGESPCDTCSEMPVCPAAYNVESYECALIAGDNEPPAEIDEGEDFDD